VDQNLSDSFSVAAARKKFKKYEWIQLDLIRNTSDFRPESYKPKSDASSISILGKIGTEREWEERKRFVLHDVFTSFEKLIQLAKGPAQKSLATLRPSRIIDFIIENNSRTWKERWLAYYDQYGLFELNERGEGKLKKIVEKVPYKYSYRFVCEGETTPHTLMIEDWEIGELYWNCLKQAEGDENEANNLVRKKYLDEFVSKKDLHFFVGTTKRYHNFALNPFVIIGVFYPPTKKDTGQRTLFGE
jgi:hypothetical protein